MEISRENPGTFFPWPGETAESGNGIVLRVMNGEALRKLDEETSEERNVVVDGELHRTRVVTDAEKRERLRLDYCIVDWTGLTEDGEEIPCTAETKVDVVRKSPVLARFVGECLEKLNDMIDKRAGIVRKN